MITSNDIIDFLNYETSSKRNFEIKYPKSIYDLDENCLTYIYIKNPELLKRLTSYSENILVIVPTGFKSYCSGLKQSFIYSPDPKIDFIRLLNKFFLSKKNLTRTDRIHKTAIIDPEATIHPSVYVGAYSIIDKCIIEEGSEIQDNVHIYSDVRIGKNVKIKSSCYIGTEDFGPVRLPDNEVIMFPQLGGLIIEDNVEIFPITAIGKGTLGNTIIKKGVKIDHCCQIGHNTQIGENTVITAGSIICGSAKIGKNCHIGPNSIIRNEFSIGDNVLVGMGTVVTKSFGNNLVIVGNPARILKKTNNWLRRIFWPKSLFCTRR